MKRISLLLALTITLVALLSSVSPAGAVPAVWPPCGDYTISAGGEYSDANLSIVYGSGIVTINSYNGWKFYRVRVVDEWNNEMIFNFPDGETSHLVVTNPSIIKFIEVELNRGCPSSTTCRPTEFQVYTLLGNYPCNLVTADYPIPERFLNRAYTGPLCQLPDMEFQWNGKYLVNQVKDCGGYLMGGRFYDTSLPSLP